MIHGIKKNIFLFRKWREKERNIRTKKRRLSSYVTKKLAVIIEKQNYLGTIHIFLSHIQDVHLTKKTTLNEVICGARDAAASELKCSDN